MTDIYKTAEEKLGICGRLLGASKSYYRQKNPDHNVLFNACVFLGENQIWHGDIDLDLDSHKKELKELAEELGEIAVTPEMPYRFEGRYPTTKREGIIYYPPASEDRVEIIKPDSND